MRFAAVAVLVPAVVLAGCSVGPRQQAGAVIGGVAGAAVGNQVAGVGGAAAGLLIGGLIGGEVGRNLDEADRVAAYQAEYNALQFGRAGTPVTWRGSNANRYGEVVPGPSYRVNEYDCRDYTHTITIDGRQQIARGTACREPDGTWKPVS